MKAYITEEMIPSSTKNISLFTKKNLIEAPKANILIVHGLAEHLGRYDFAAEKLNEYGYNVYRFDNQGHGKSQGERGYLKDFNQFIDDANIMVDKIAKENNEIPTFMLGHSMGGFITAAYGVKYPGKLAGQILSGAAIIVLPLFEGLKDVDFETSPYEKMPNDLSHLICTDQSIVEAYDNDPLVLKETCQKLLGEVFINGADWLTKNISNYNYPCLILHGGDDQIVIPKASEFMYENISSADKEIKIYDKFYHEILNEVDKETVFKDIKTWLEQHIN